jgi:subtilisin family serine protease
MVIIGIQQLSCGAARHSNGTGGGSDADPAVDPDSPESGPSDAPEDFAFAEDADPGLADQPFVADQLIVRTFPGALDADVQDAYAEVGTVVLETLPEIEVTVLGVDPEALTTAAAALLSNPLFEAVQKNYLFAPERIPDDPEFDAQDYLQAVGLPRAWDMTTGSEAVVIAILDSGVEADHPDLSDKLAPGWNTFEDHADTEDLTGHGTSVAGIAAAATDDGTGVAGVSWDSPIMPVRVTNTRGQASSRAIAAGILWAVDHGAQVINVSFAPLESDRTVLRAARYARSAGALVVISAGNDGRTASVRQKRNATFVAATDADQNLAWFSTRGPFVDLAAPGTNITTSKLGGTSWRVSGTSFSSPIVAGVAALIWSVQPGLRPATVEQILADTARDLGEPGRDDEYGAGLVDAAAAVAVADMIVEEEDLDPPEVSITSPRDGAVVSGVILVRATATDATDVADVVLSIDGRSFATDSASPFRFALSTSYRLGPGVHTLSCIATDTSGNTSWPAEIRVVVDPTGTNGTSGLADTIDPTVTVNFPVDGTSVITSVGIQATVTDNDALARVEWLVDGGVRRTTAVSGSRANVSFAWDASEYTRGSHLIAVRVSDIAGNQAVATINLTRP